MHVAPLSRFVRHEHLVVTVEADAKERIDADLGAGESLESWVADAIEQKLDRKAAGSDSGDSDPDRSDSTHSGLGSEFVDITDLGAEDSDSSESGTSDRADGDRTESGEEIGRDESDEYDEGFEYVDDCAI